MTQEQERIFWREEGDPHEKEVGPKGGNGEQILTNTIIYGYRKPWWTQLSYMPSKNYNVLIKRKEYWFGEKIISNASWKLCLYQSWSKVLGLNSYEPPRTQTQLSTPQMMKVRLTCERTCLCSDSEQIVGPGPKSDAEPSSLTTDLLVGRSRKEGWGSRQDRQWRYRSKADGREVVEGEKCGRQATPAWQGMKNKGDIMGDTGCRRMLRD